VAIGDRCRVGDGAKVRDAVLLPGAAIEPGEVVADTIRWGAGPLEHLRPFEAALAAGRPE